jgi:hypothetical protein
MNSAERDANDRDANWERIGRAAEHFARRVARDAGKFAERLQEHAGEFADDVARDWRRAQHGAWRGCRRAYRYGEPEMRRVFDDIRTVLADVLDGFEEFVEGLFPDSEPRRPRPQSESRAWTRVVANREGTCSACARGIAAGDEAWLRRTPDGVTFRCATCGAPASETSGPSD